MSVIKPDLSGRKISPRRYLISHETTSFVQPGSKVHWSLQWRHNKHNCVSNHQPHHCLLNRLFRRRSKKTSKLRVTGLCVGNLPVTFHFPAQMANNAENVFIWWRHHVTYCSCWHHGDYLQQLVNGMCAQLIPEYTYRTLVNTDRNLTLLT